MAGGLIKRWLIDGVLGKHRVWRSISRTGKTLTAGLWILSGFRSCCSVSGRQPLKKSDEALWRSNYRKWKVFTGSGGQKQSGLRGGGVKTKTWGVRHLKGGGVWGLCDVTKSQSRIWTFSFNLLKHLAVFIPPVCPNWINRFLCCRRDIPSLQHASSFVSFGDGAKASSQSKRGSRRSPTPPPN